MFYYEILPLKKTGNENQVFTYESEQKIKSGNLVTIPLRNKHVKGLVTTLVKKPAFDTRPIFRILTDEPPVTDFQLKIAQKMADYYFCSLGEAINAIFPFEFGKKRRKAISDKQEVIREKENSLKLTDNQDKIVKNIESSKPNSKHLLFGVTGSGKTEIYLQLIEKALKEGKGAIVLVPEISLTPQTVSRFEKRFPGKVAVWHSGMKETEKFQAWEEIYSGKKMVVVGARSAIFSPVKNLAYIIIDEEHEASYKQDQTPRYEAHQIAEWLSELTQAKLILGSATPKIETFYKTEKNGYFLHTMNKRIVQDEMPPVTVVDLREEFQKGNKSIFSDKLFEAVQQALKEGKQVLLFVNRRGAATFVVCRDCGHVSSCPNCEIPLTYHPSEGQILKCHHCGYKTGVPTTCPTCKSFAIKYFGLGTQRTEIEAQKLFPKAKIGRMDKDTTLKRGSHEDYYTKFKSGDYDILIGTQIIAKGWDLPNVSVVGVISADTALNIPDFRSGERTFSLLTQVAGRTGRGLHSGKVIIQTYSPENYAVVAAKNHDYASFYNQEIKERQKYGFPPFARLAKLTFSALAEEKVVSEATNLASKIKTAENIEVLGPIPAYIPKLGNKYRYHIILKSKSNIAIHKGLKKIKNELKKGWTIDINPENLL